MKKLFEIIILSSLAIILSCVTKSSSDISEILKEKIMDFESNNFKEGTIDSISIFKIDTLTPLGLMLLKSNLLDDRANRRRNIRKKKLELAELQKMAGYSNELYMKDLEEIISEAKIDVDSMEWSQELLVKETDSISFLYYMVLYTVTKTNNNNIQTTEESGAFMTKDLKFKKESEIIFY